MKERPIIEITGTCRNFFIDANEITYIKIFLDCDIDDDDIVKVNLKMKDGELIEAYGKEDDFLSITYEIGQLFRKDPNCSWVTLFTYGKLREILSKEKLSEEKE